MTRHVDETWKKTQETTFTNWVNTSLRGHLKTAKRQVKSLETDLQDGLILVQLLETLASPKKIERYNKNPLIKPQKIENLGACFRFFEQENIKLVNIGTLKCWRGSLVCIEFTVCSLWTIRL